MPAVLPAVLEANSAGEARVPEHSWRDAARRHAERAAALTAGHRARRLRGERHPVEDFLWTYYSVKPNELARWHPGAGVFLEGAAEERGAWRHYRPSGRDAAVDLPTFFSRRGGTVDYVEQLLTATLAHPPRFGCFGLHEWAMVYRLTPEQIRHSQLELRIGHEATDRVVESNPISCTHFDAYRFFTPDAAPLNALRPTRDTQPELEQSACLHAGMDVYKWAAKLGPIVPGEVLLDAFVLARDIREVDMRASPYDVRAFRGASGDPLTPIPIETPDGKREYSALQRGFARRGDELRHRVLAAIGVARAALAAAAEAR
ncbi:3-methyladenine DNA glycosylase [Leucobacter edaphi]|uniref:3-methyladenine DNA glycosylase n=1 Tax=Leucobacter edaphi TaxID=2796472 RepID=UPI0034E28E73